MFIKLLNYNQTNTIMQCANAKCRRFPWWNICEVRPVMAQNAVNRHGSTYTDRRAAIVMTKYPVINPHNAPGLFLCISCTSLGSHLKFVNSFNGITGKFNLCHRNEKKLLMFKRRRFHSPPREISAR